MNKIAIVYWSGTGNTAAMAEKIRKGAEEKGANVQVYKSGEFEPDMMEAFDVVAFGCPAMGAESLEDVEFKPVFDSCAVRLENKKIALFGSYGWGSGKWLERWEDDCRDCGADIVADSVSCCGFPEGEAAESCYALGAQLANV